jgi:hypothetical protein
MDANTLSAIDAVLVRRKGSAVTVNSARYAANQWLTARNMPSITGQDFRVALLTIGIDIAAGPYGDTLPGIALEQSAYKHLRASRRP